MQAYESNRGEIEVIALDDVEPMPDWPVDEGIVEKFRVTIRTHGADAIPIFQVNRTQGAKGSGTYRTTDGLHRVRALTAEGITHHVAEILDLDPEAETMLRIQASMGKPDLVLQQRAVRAIRELFGPYIARNELDGVTFYRPVYDDDGNVRAVPREGPLPSDPVEVAFAFMEHRLAVPDAGERDASQEWECALSGFVAQMCARLGVDPRWLRDEVLGMHLFAEGALRGPKALAFVKELTAIPDYEIREMVWRRLLRERAGLTISSFQDAVDYLGCVPPQRKTHAPWLPKRTREDMKRLIAGNTLQALHEMYVQALYAYERENAPTPPAPPSPAPTPPLTKPEHIIGTVSPSFLPTPAPAPASARPTPSAPVVPPTHQTRPSLHVVSPVPVQAPLPQPPAVPFDAVREAARIFLQTLAVYDRAGGDWARADVQAVLRQVRDATDRYAR